MSYKDKEKQKEYQAKRYQKFKEKYCNSLKIRRYEIRKWLFKIKAEYGCKVCREMNPVCLQFHHRNPDDKNNNVSALTLSGCGKKRLLEEIKKCDILCANCHLKLHAEKDSWKILQDD